MNDRVSQKPPVPYLGTDEEIYGRYESDHHGDSRGRKMAQPRKVTHNRDSSVAVSSVTGKSETSRHSSIFRFGKSIAASFNPSNWKIWQKQNQQLDDEETVQQQILRERQEKAEQIYKELKQSGHFRGANGSVPSGRFVRADDLKVPQSKHDSGVDLGDNRASGTRYSMEWSREEKRRGRVFLEPPKVPGSHRDPSPAFNGAGSVMDSKNSTPRRQSFNLARASLSNIKKAFTHESDSTPSQDGQNQARRIPSRKDLQKQQKLVKRVSDLEGKLEAARRQLSDSRGEPIPYQPTRVGRNKFVPGALSSLPSERLLSGYVSSDGNIGDNESENEIGRAVTIDHQNGNLPVMSSARVDTDMKELGHGNKAAVGVSTEKPLPYPPETQNQVIQSVEEDDLCVKVPIQKGGSVQQQEIQMTTESSEISSANDSNYEESEIEESDKEPTPRLQPVKISPKKNPAPRRKRKSNTFERMADDGGRYKPGADSESDNESDLSLTTTKKKLSTSKPPRKLQKVVQEPTKPSSPPKSKASAGNKGPKSAANVAPATRQSSQRSVRSTTKLVKHNAPRSTRQSVSPPPSSSFTGLNYAKPSASATSKTGGVAYIADPSTGHGVPPMPKMPQSVRLASGEMVDTSAASSASAKLTKTKPAAQDEKKTTLPRSEPSFVWPDDVF
jgi:hypothetical protein